MFFDSATRMGVWLVLGGLVLALQLFTGTTVTSDRFRGFDESLPAPRIRQVRFVHRDEEPVVYWIVLGLQIILVACPVVVKWLSPPATI